MTRRGFTLVEMLTAVAALVILSGLMVSLSRHVRASSANELTRKILLDLATTLEQYQSAGNGAVPNVAPIIEGAIRPNESELHTAAMRNSVEVLRVLRRQNLSHQFLSGLPEWMFDQATLRDAWGSPIVYMPSMHPLIGMAPSDRPFFFSAGPDRRFLSREDNLYSYEEERGR